MDTSQHWNEIKLVETPRTPSQEDVEYRKRVEADMRRRYPTIPELELALEIERAMVVALTDEIDPASAEVAQARDLAREARDLAKEAETIAARIRTSFMQLENAFKQAERERNEGLREINRLEAELGKVRNSKEPFFVPGEGLVFANQKDKYNPTLQSEQRLVREEVDRQFATQERLALARQRAKFADTMGEMKKLNAKVERLKRMNEMGAEYIRETLTKEGL